MIGASLPVLTHYLSARLPNMILLDSPISQWPTACLPGLGKGESETFQSLLKGATQTTGPATSNES